MHLRILVLLAAVAFAGGAAHAMEATVVGHAQHTAGGATTQDDVASATGAPYLLTAEAGSLGTLNVGHLDAAFGAPGFIDGEFGQTVFGGGGHQARVATTATDSLTNGSGASLAASLNLRIFAGSMLLQDIKSSIDPLGGPDLDVTAVGYLGLEISVVGLGPIEVGTLFLSRETANPAANITLSNGLLGGLNGLALNDQPANGLTQWTWADTDFSIPLGLLDDGESVAVIYRLITAVGADGTGVECSAGNCPYTLINFDDPCTRCSIARSASFELALTPLPAPPVVALALAPPLAKPLLPTADLVGLRLPPVSVPAPGPFELIGIALLVIIRRVINRRTISRQNV